MKANLSLHDNFSPRLVLNDSTTFFFFFFVTVKLSNHTLCTAGQKSMFNLGRNCGLVVTFCHVHEWLGRTLKEVWIELVTERNDPKLPS